MTCMKSKSPMDNDLYEEQQFPSGLLTGICFNIASKKDTEKISVLAVDAVSDLSDPKLGVPNLSNECLTCGAKDTKNCEGHFGFIDFPFTIVHPFFLSEAAKILNKICPGCKSIKQELQVKLDGDSALDHNQPKGCKYCVVHYLLKSVDLKFIKKFVLRTDSLFLNCFPVTPNYHRVCEITHTLPQQLFFDDRTRAYKKLVGFTGTANELGSRVLDCLKFSKLSSGKSSNNGLASAQQKNGTDPSSSSGLRWIKDVVLGKRSDHCFRMVVVGDPYIKLSEIGIPCHIAEQLQISESLNRWNFDKFIVDCTLSFIEKGKVYVRRKGELVCVHHINELQIGDTMYRPLNNGDIVLINRPPSIHQHSLIALSVKLLPITSVVSINPLCCSPLRGDFDGDCLHGYVSQSIDARVELSELVALDRQVIDGQNGRNLLSLSQDSLTAAHLIMEDGVLLNLFQLQQLQMFCPYQFPLPAIVKAPSLSGSVWTGKQLFSMLLPPGFGYVFPSNGVHVSNGELLSSEGSFWLCDNDSNLFHSLVKYCRGKVVDFLYAAQEVLCEWLSMQGLSVSLSDLYLCSNSRFRKNMMDEINFGLKEEEQTSNFKLLMIDSCQDFLAKGGEENSVVLDVEHFYYEKQKSAALCQVSADAFKQVFRDIQTLVYKYASKDNSFLVMFKAGSKGNLLKLVQHSMCLGLQHSMVPLSFRIPHQLSCASWNNRKAQKVENSSEHAGSYIPYAVVENSFLAGLNPFECFVHSVASRDSSFSANADLPGTLNRRLMFLMRDLYTAYDGTVRNAYGNHLIQFSYNINKDKSTPNSSTHDLFSESVDDDDAIGGQPVGSWSAAAISEVAYSALDQPISLLQTSPLLNLKNILECGSRKHNSDTTWSIFFSGKLGRQTHGFEYGALEVKNHLERLIFSDIVSTVMITFSPQTFSETHFSPWVCHFHLCKEIVKRRGLTVHSIMSSLHKRCNSSETETESEPNLPNLQILSDDCSVVETQKEDNDALCITVAIPEIYKTPLALDSVRDSFIPFILQTVVKGFPEIKKVDILWNDQPKVSRRHHGSFGELYLRVAMSAGCDTTDLESLISNDCVQVTDLIDWSRSHPDNVHDIVLAFGIEAGWKYFLKSLEVAISDVGKSIHPQHLVLVADSLSATGEFVGLNARGIARQREHASVSSPFMQACFSNPGACFLNAAKAGVVDNLKGNLDALAWGNVPSTGTGGHFDILYSGKMPELEKPVDFNSLMVRQTISDKQNLNTETHECKSMSDNSGAQLVYKYGGLAMESLKKLESKNNSVLKRVWTPNDIMNLSHALKQILHKYPINQMVNDQDKSILMTALYFHPRREEKFGIGAKDVHAIKVVCHPKYQNTRCFEVERNDGTTEDFSYHKCVIAALEIIDPKRAEAYKSKWLQNCNS
ncbi:hypothetical protein CMV_002506 [Castanea mollissima]|uniref:DNA-directed RNA polymerase n=1 Tax=Castanea mollissima TaxID=60419 RepID=A0A8J4RUK4_9ROSI|nr:hypothetical protein CMV_002506 [Castanea mollissima]